MMFDLPQSTIVKKIIPKNSFDSFFNNNQKKELSENVARITWQNKIAFDTVNLQGGEIKEIQVFLVELKKKGHFMKLLNLLDKYIPYNIIFLVQYKNEFLISTSIKHTNPINEGLMVIDYTYTSPWLDLNDRSYKIVLKKNLDHVMKLFCEQFMSNSEDSLNTSLKELTNRQIEKDKLSSEMERLKSEIAKCKQFNRKVELNLKLKELIRLYKMNNYEW